MNSGRKRVLYFPEWYGFYAEQGIVDFALQARWVLTSVSDHGGNLDQALRSARHYDGIITLIRQTDSAIGELIRSATVPTVDLTDTVDELNLPRVLPDDQAIGRLGADHLMDQGFEHLTFFRATASGQTRDRAHGFDEQVESRGRTLHRLDAAAAGLSVMDRSADRERIPWLADQLSRLPRPLGGMIQFDALYWHILESCAAASLHIPRDVAVISVGNVESLCKLSEPTLTSVDPNHRRQGYEAAALLDRLMDGAPAPTSALRIPPAHVEIRESTDIYAVDDETLRAALRFMREHFRDPALTVEDIVKASGTSRRYLYSTFENHWPRPIADTLAEFRVVEAKRLLATTHLKQYSVAVQSGFSSEAKMSRAFAKRVGITPGDFRSENAPAPGVSKGLLADQRGKMKTFSVTEDTYQHALGSDARVMVLKNNATGELAEILLNTPHGFNRSTGAGAVNGLLLRDPGSGELRELLPHRGVVAGGLMAPFANRVRYGRYLFDGRQHQLTRNWDERETRMTRSGQHAIHGLLPQELEVVSRQATDDSARLTLRASFDGTDTGYPFAIDVAFTYCLDSTGLAIEVAATNVSATGQPAPFMVGWHPFIQLQGPVDRTVVAFDRRSGYNLSVPTCGGPDGPERDSHPTGVTVPSTDFTDGQPLGEHYWDDGFKATASARSVPRLETRVQDSGTMDSSLATVVLWQDAQCRFIQVYTGLRDRGLIAVEPMSGQTDCFNNGDGLVVIQAGEVWETAFGLRLELP